MIQAESEKKQQNLFATLFQVDARERVKDESRIKWGRQYFSIQRDKLAKYLKGDSDRW